MAKPLFFAAFVMNTASHILHGVWRKPDGHQVNFNSLDLWVDLAKELEAGLFDAIFFADVTGLYSEYKGSHRKHIEMGLQIPSNDPSVILSALAYNTEHLGLAFTSNIMQEHPFNFARKISTLDHASKGRIAWNIVTNPLTNAAHNFGQDLTPHDERYVWAGEYVDVTYKLWEGSWDDGALLQDRKAGISGDYDKIHRINHVGERYSVEGPHLVAPSPQRTPLLFQAGSSEAGMNFAAANAEAQFLVVPRPEIAASVIETTRSLLPKYGRSREDIKFFQGLSFVVGSTEEEAERKSRELDEAIDLDTMMAHLSGGIEELDAYDLDQPLADIQTEGIRSILDWVEASVKGRKATVRDFAIRSGRSSRVTGTPAQIADKLETWQIAGIDGINVINATIPGSYTEFIAHVMPELQKRGLAKREYTPGTLRQKLFGRDTLADTHPAAAYRGAFR